MKTTSSIVIVWLACVTFGIAAYEYVWIDTNTGTYKPARVEADQHSNVQAITGRFDVLYVAGVRIVGTGSTVITEADAPVSGLVVTPTNFTPTIRPDMPSFYGDAAFWYSFSSPQDYVVDDTGSGNHGVKLPATRLPSWANYGMRFDRISDNYIGQSSSTSILSGAIEMTLGLWLNVSTPITNNDALLMAGGSSNYFGLWADATNIYSQVVGDGYESKLPYAYTTGLATGSWHRLIAVYRKTGAAGSAEAEHELWLDGAMVANTSTATNLFIGNRHKFLVINTDATLGHRFIDGDIDDVFVLDRAASALEITNDFNGGRSMGNYEYAKTTPYPVSAVRPTSGASTETGTAQVVEWSVSSVADEYRLSYWSNAVAETVVSLTSNSYNIGATYNNATNYWKVVASNAYGQATSSVFVFYPSTWNTNLYTNFALYANMLYNETNKVSDKNPRLGLDNLAVAGGAAWESYSVGLNKDLGYDDYLYQTSNLAYTNNMTVGFFVKFYKAPTNATGQFTLLSDSTMDTYSTARRFRFRQDADDTSVHLWYTNTTYNYAATLDATLTWSSFFTNTWYHYAFTIENGASLTLKLYVNGILRNTATTAVAGTRVLGITAPYFIGINPSNPDPGGMGINPAIEIDDFFITDSVLTESQLKALSDQGRSQSKAY